MTDPTIEQAKVTCPSCGLPTSRWDDAASTQPPGWYCDGPNDQTTDRGCFTLTPDEAFVTRRLKSTSTYIDDYEHERVFDILIPVAIIGEEDVADVEALYDLLQPESGAGHYGPDGRSVDAWYEITSIDGLEPTITWDAVG